jgi:hypothetical protein
MRNLLLGRSLCGRMSLGLRLQTKRLAEISNRKLSICSNLTLRRSKGVLGDDDFRFDSI